MAVSASLNVQWRTNSRRSVGGSNSAAIWASLSCCRRISRVSPEVKTRRPADPGQGVDEHVAPEAKDAANRGLHGAAVDAELDTLSLADFRGPTPARSQFVRLCYKNWPLVSSSHPGIAEIVSPRRTCADQ